MLAATLRAHLKMRRLREEIFGASLFGEPSWDILVDVFAAELDGDRLSVSAACNNGASSTTCLRHIDRPTDVGLIERHADRFDGRRSYLYPTPLMRARMTALLKATTPVALLLREIDA